VNGGGGGGAGPGKYGAGNIGYVIITYSAVAVTDNLGWKRPFMTFDFVAPDLIVQASGVN
jgi:hypothetical protein